MDMRAFLRVAPSVALLGLGACDRTITHGADGEPEWARRLIGAVPVGTRVDSARSTMERNGFQCSAGTDSVPHLWCDKTSGKHGLVHRRWQAVLNLDRDRVIEVRASTGLVGP